MEGHVANHPVGEEPNDWEHIRVHQCEVGDIGIWNVNVWIQKGRDGERMKWKCTASARRPFSWQNGYDTEYEAINAWWHVGDEC